MTSDVKSNKWVSHIKKYASENGISYREAMRDEGCKTAYKTPVERLPSPVRTPSPEPVETKKPRARKVKLEPLPVPELVRSEPEPVPVSEPELLIPTVVKKERVKRSPKMVPT
jgi:hypothetical protein